MKWLNCYRIRLMLVGIVAAGVLGGESAKAEIIMSEPTHIGQPINDSYDLQECDFSHDGLELYFAPFAPEGRGGYGGNDIWVSQRETLNSPWQEPVNLGPTVNSSEREAAPAISPNDLELYFYMFDDWYLCKVTRPSRDDPWSSPVKVGPPVGAYEAVTPDVSGDGLSLYFASSNRPGGYGSNDIWVARRATIDDEWGEPVNLGLKVNSSGNDVCPTISTDGLTLVFNRGLDSLWATTRKSIEDDWGPAVMLGIDGPGYLYGPALSPDGSTMYFQASRKWGGLGADDIWQVAFTPIFDFNSDEVVDITDLAVLIEHWGEEDPSFDIGPLPLGDGKVDQADLEVLMNHWEQEVLPPDLIAYWKLDETEGDIAYDIVAVNDAVVFGGAVWQPTGGMMDGALELDGIDDYLSTPFVLSPADEEFSVFAWIKGGAPGQAVLSQAGGARWLCADPSDGKLMTELVPPPGGRSVPQPLMSEFVVTDGNWHRIGLVWDGSHRTLYVDDVAVAEDEQANLEASENGLYIGTGKAMEPGSFWSGLIDDVRIYNRVVRP